MTDQMNGTKDLDSTTMADKRPLVERIADAVLYEGYMLYPYRPSVKNRQRWNFGGLYPKAYSNAQGGAEPWTMQTDVLITGTRSSRSHGTVRFLHLLDRRVGAISPPLAEWPKEGGEPPFQPVPMLEIAGKPYYSWQEAVERSVSLDDFEIGDLVDRTRKLTFRFPASRIWESLLDCRGMIAGILAREQQAIEGAVEISARRLADDLYGLRIRVLNHTPFEEAERCGRDAALLRSLVSSHTILEVNDAEFVSLLDPPEGWRDHASACENQGTWPVLVGAAGERQTMLSSPIILYDYPEIAPESPGDLFDGTEIDEILTMRILTLTDDEKRSMAAIDERARALLQRTESMGQEQLLGLHGTMRGIRVLDSPRGVGEKPERRHGD